MLGNWVLAGTKTQFPMQVVGIFQDEVYLDFEGNEGDVWEEKEEDMFPVPLTEEILLKNGFTKASDYFKDSEDYVFIRFDRAIDINVRISSPDMGAGIATYNKTRYLHELQNLLTMAGIKMEFKI